MTDSLSSISEALSSDKTCILVIDMQRDFLEGGALAVGGADYDKYLPSVQAFTDLARSVRFNSNNSKPSESTTPGSAAEAAAPDSSDGKESTASAKLHIVFSQDFHPPRHSSFASTHQPEDEPFSRKSLSRPSGEEYEQVLWPDHCVQGTPGAELMMKTQEGEHVQEKGTRLEYDSYSAFIDDGGLKTGLDELLKKRGVENVVLYGLATDYCVAFSAKDAVKCGFKAVYVIQELCRGIDPTYSWSNFTDAGVKTVSLDEATATLTRQVEKQA